MKTSKDKLVLLQTEMAELELAAEHLRYSLARCADLPEFNALSLEQLERLESLTSRFARLSDLLIQRIFRLVDSIELNDTGSILDRLYRAEKRGWANADTFIQIRELRNLIAHEYASEAMSEIYLNVKELSSTLLTLLPKVGQTTDTLLVTHIWKAQ